MSTNEQAWAQVLADIRQANPEAYEALKDEPPQLMFHPVQTEELVAGLKRAMDAQRKVHPAALRDLITSLRDNHSDDEGYRRGQQDAADELEQLLERVRW